MSDGGNAGRSCCGSLFTFVLTSGFVVLIYWAIFQPHQIRATVESATLTNLTVANGTTVSYSLAAVTLNLYNPSLRVNIYYDALAAELRYRGALLGDAATSSPAEFYQRRKTSDDVKVEFNGAAAAVGVFPGDVASELEKEVAQGAVALELAVHAQVRYRFGVIKIRRKPRVWCAVTIPVKADGSRGGGVGGVLAAGDRCSVKY